jgi:glucose/arabinose dehydrogenase
MTRLIIPLVILFLALIGFTFLTHHPPPPTPLPLSSSIPQSSQSSSTNTTEIIAKQLDTPWELVFLPDKSILLTERPGQLIKINQGNNFIQQIADVHETSEGGLMGLALHPNFTSNHWLYLFLTYSSPKGLFNRIERYTFENNQLSNKTIILDGIKASQFHDGGRLAFGPDGNLYITTGDASNDQLAQDINSLNGKILRVKDDGSIPPDNPFNNAVYSYGHRNPQGLAWDDRGNLWETEHGPSGTQTGHDELNLIQKGKNYGWPIIVGDQTKENMITPVLNSGSDTWAPSNLQFINGSLFFTGLRGQALYEVKLKGTSISPLIAHFKNKYGRLRVLKLGPDKVLYLGTSNLDGRGQSKPNDDQIIKFDLDTIK